MPEYIIRANRIYICLCLCVGVCLCIINAFVHNQRNIYKSCLLSVFTYSLYAILYIYIYIYIYIVLTFHFSFFLSISLSLYIYIYIGVRVCWCVGVINVSVHNLASSWWRMSYSLLTLIKSTCHLARCLDHVTRERKRVCFNL